MNQYRFTENLVTTFFLWSLMQIWLNNSWLKKEQNAALVTTGIEKLGSLRVLKNIEKMICTYDEKRWKLLRRLEVLQILFFYTSDNLTRADVCTSNHDSAIYFNCCEEAYQNSIVFNPPVLCMGSSAFMRVQRENGEKTHFDGKNNNKKNIKWKYLLRKRTKTARLSSLRPRY